MDVVACSTFTVCSRYLWDCEEVSACCAVINREDFSVCQAISNIFVRQQLGAVVRA